MAKGHVESPGLIRRTARPTSGEYYEAKIGKTDSSASSEYRRYVYDPPSDVVGDKFRRLVDTWNSETTYLSDPTKMAMHPAYQQIIGLGPRAIPLILAELRKSPDHWFWALNAIVGCTPHHDDKHAGDIQEIANDWLDWGKRVGYI